MSASTCPVTRGRRLPVPEHAWYETTHRDTCRANHSTSESTSWRSTRGHRRRQPCRCSGRRGPVADAHSDRRRVSPGPDRTGRTGYMCKSDRGTSPIAGGPPKLDDAASRRDQPRDLLGPLVPPDLIAGEIAPPSIVGPIQHPMTHVPDDPRRITRPPPQPPRAAQDEPSSDPRRPIDQRPVHRWPISPPSIGWCDESIEAFHALLAAPTTGPLR